MILPRRVQAVVFDMDGLLIDSEVLYTEAVVGEANTRGAAIGPDFVKQMIGNTWAISSQLLRDAYGLQFATDDFRSSVTVRFRELCQARLALKAGAEELLTHLETCGVPRALCTSAMPEDVDHNFTALRLHGRFHAVVAQGDYAQSKPHPAPYLRAAELLGVQPHECLALEDSHNGVRAAAAAGMMTVMVRDLLDPTEEMHALAIHIARDLHEVRELLERQGS